MTNTPMTKEDILLYLYKIYAYNPYDAVGNPLTAFGNFCEGYQACQAHNDAVIAELKTRIGDVTQMYQEKLDERDKTITELVEALEDIKSKTYQPQALIALHAMNDINKIATSLIAKHKKD